MARQNLTKTIVPGPNPSAGEEITWTAADTVNKEQFSPATGDVLLVWNTDGSPQTYSIDSVPDPIFGRSGDIDAEDIAAGEIHVLRLGIDGWRQADGKIYLEASDAAVKFAILTGL